MRHIRNYESSINKIFAQLQTSSNASQSIISKKSAAIGQSGDNLQQSFVQTMNEMAQQSIDPNVVSLEISPDGKDSFEVSPDIPSSKRHTPHLNNSPQQNSQQSQRKQIVVANEYENLRSPKQHNPNQVKKKSSSRKSEQK